MTGLIQRNGDDGLQPIMDIVTELTALRRALAEVEYVNPDRLSELALALRVRLDGQPRLQSPVAEPDADSQSRRLIARRRAWCAARTLAGILVDASHQFHIGDHAIRPVLVRTLDQIESVFGDIVWLENARPDTADGAHETAAIVLV